MDTEVLKHLQLPKPNRGERFLRLLKYVLCAVGCFLLFKAATNYAGTHEFLNAAVKARATVERMIRVRASEPGDSPTWRPVVNFVTEDGLSQTFESSVSHSPPKYRKGDVVSVLYNPSNPNDARIDQFMEKWAGAMFPGLIGAVFFLLGLGWVCFAVRKYRRFQKLKTNGMLVSAKIHQVVSDNTVKKNGKSAFRVIALPVEKDSGGVDEYRSRRMWNNPSRQLRERLITVVVDRADPDNYHMDLPHPPLKT